jgi:hypothetical protein
MENLELKAMDSVYRVLKELEPSAQERVLNWVIGSLGIIFQTKASPAKSIMTEVRTDISSVCLDEFETISDLLAATSPKSDSEKVLVVGSFLQTKMGKRELASFEINSELKHMGHRVSNVTQAISSLMARKPQLMIQTRKDGKSQQARKSYKVTSEGLKVISQMLTPHDA